MQSGYFKGAVNIIYKYILCCFARNVWNVSIFFNKYLIFFITYGILYFTFFSPLRPINIYLIRFCYKYIVNKATLRILLCIYIFTFRIITVSSINAAFSLKFVNVNAFFIKYTFKFV